MSSVSVSKMPDAGFLCFCVCLFVYFSFLRILFEDSEGLSLMGLITRLVKQPLFST